MMDQATADRMFKAGRILFFTGLSIWIGGIASLWVVASTLFDILPAREAGEYFASIVRRFNYLEIGCAISILGGLLLLTAATPKVRRFDVLRLVLAGVMLALLLVNTLAIRPSVIRLRAAIYDQVHDQEDLVKRGDFDRMHAWSTRLFGANFLIGFALLLMSAAPVRHKKEDDPGAP